MDMMKLSMSLLHPGIYVLQARDAQGILFRTRFLKGWGIVKLLLQMTIVSLIFDPVMFFWIKF